MTEAIFEQRFDFLTLEQRSVLRAIWRDGNTGASEGFAQVTHELVCALADHIDSEAEWQRIERMTPAEVEAELVAAGFDLDEVRKSTAAIRAKVERMMAESQAASDKARLDNESPSQPVTP